MYNQKMLELQKKNGIGMLGACLPMLISLVILIVAFQGFRSYSQYANLNLFAGMSENYNAAILQQSVDGVDYKLRTEEDESYTLVWTEDGEEKTIPNFTWTTGETLQNTGSITYLMTEREEQVEGKTVMRKYILVSSADKYIQYYYNPEVTYTVRVYEVDKDKLYEIDNKAQDAVKAIWDASLENDDLTDDLTEEDACAEYVYSKGADAAAKYYKGNTPNFLWVNNVWYPDVSYNHPVPTYKQFSDTLNVKVTIRNEDGTSTRDSLTNILNKTKYEKLTSSLKTEKSQPNGYFILIILSIGLMVVSQLITMKSSKESNQYQTVDGQGAKTQKMMLVIMPLIYAVFAFMYSAAFSIYMIMSSFFAICVTLLSNLILGRIFNKKEEEEFKEEHTYVPKWMKDQENNKKNDKKNDKKGKRK